VIRAVQPMFVIARRCGNRPWHPCTSRSSITAPPAPAGQLRAFIETINVLWFQGKLADKVHSAFTASSTAHGGQESTILLLDNTFCHWGGIIVPPGYTDRVQFRSGNPYGTSHVSGDGPPGEVILQAARHPGPPRRGHRGRAQGRPRRLMIGLRVQDSHR
jgi:hypothetical protein